MSPSSKPSKPNRRKQKLSSLNAQPDDQPNEQPLYCMNPNIWGETHVSIHPAVSPSNPQPVLEADHNPINPLPPDPGHIVFSSEALPYDNSQEPVNESPLEPCEDEDMSMVPETQPQFDQSLQEEFNDAVEDQVLEQDDVSDQQDLMIQPEMEA